MQAFSASLAQFGRKRRVADPEITSSNLVRGATYSWSWYIIEYMPRGIFGRLSSRSRGHMITYDTKETENGAGARGFVFLAAELLPLMEQ